MVCDVEVGFSVCVCVVDDLQDRVKCQGGTIDCIWCRLFVDDLD